jgi:hypothetical protein
MLIPQYSLRWMLAVTSVLAVVFLIFAQAVRGSSWAVGVSLALVVLAGTMLVHGLLFFLVWVFALIGQRRQQRRQASKRPAGNQGADSPFASPLASQAPPTTVTAGAEEQML